MVDLQLNLSTLSSFSLVFSKLFSTDRFLLVIKTASDSFNSTSLPLSYCRRQITKFQLTTLKMSWKKKEHIFEPKAVLTDIRLCCDGTWDWMQSRTGRKRIRLIFAPIFLVGSILLLVIGAGWAKLLAPECGQDLPSAKFSSYPDGVRRLLSGNSCPGYDWNSQTRPKDRETAGEYKFSYSVPLVPIISITPTFVGKSNSVPGPIGVALNGIPIYGPSISDGEDSVEEYGRCSDRVQFNACCALRRSH